jgi:porin
MWRCNPLILLALCLVWSCGARGLAQTSKPSTSHSGLDEASNLADSEIGGVSSTSTAPQPPPFGGPWDSRPKLTGDWGGLREQFRDHGFTFDLSSTTFYQGIASGGLERGSEFGGRNDYWLNVDGQKAGLWPGFFLTLRGETVYGDSVNAATGAIVPVNIGRAHPHVSDDQTALTAVKFTQALSEKFVVYAGKINTIDLVQQPFMPERGKEVGFMNAAFVWNPINGRTMNYSALGAGAAILANGQAVATLTVYDTHDATTTTGFDNLFDDGAVINSTLSLPTKFVGMPGHHTLMGAYSSGRYDIVDPQSLNQIPQGLPPRTILERGSWWLTYLFDQALWVDPADKTRSWGVFGNFGLSDGKPNPIHWSAIFGVGGSSPIPGRNRDTFGIAYYYLGYSDDFKEVARLVVPVRDERGLELFYNAAITPWCHITPDLQVITPTLGLAETSVVLGLRTKIDF